MLLHTLESFVSDLKHHVSLAMTNYYSKVTQHKYKKDDEDKENKDNNDEDEDAEKTKLLKNNRCTQCHKTTTQTFHGMQQFIL